MFQLVRELRFVFRSFSKDRSFSVLSILTLALGIGANAAIFSIIQAVLLQPLPYPEESRLFWIWGHNAESSRALISPPDFRDYWENQTSFEAMGAFVGQNRVLQTRGGSIQVSGALVSKEFFSTLNVPAALGRVLDAPDFAPDAPLAIVLSQGFFKDYFGGDADLLGSELQVDQDRYTVVGIMPENFGLLPATLMLPGRADFWIPFDLTIPEAGVRRFRLLSAVGRLREELAPEAARAELDRIALDLELRYPDTNTGWGLSFAPLREELAGDLQTSLWILFGAVFLVLMIACVNVANLLLVRGARRQREISLRSALGASRLRILRQLVLEGLVLSVLSTLSGVILAEWILVLLLQLSPGDIPRLEQSGLNWQVVTFLAGISMATALVFGLIPALHVFSKNPEIHFKERDSISSLLRSRFRRILVVGEQALAMVLLLSTGLLLKSFHELKQVDPGFRPQSVTTARISLAASKFQEPVPIHRFMSDLVREVSSLPGIEGAGLVDRVPMLHRGNDTVFVKQGESLADRKLRRGAYIRAASEGYFRALGIPLLRGRLFDERDRDASMGSAIISQTLAEQVWPGEDPVGRTLLLDIGEAAPFQIVGVVGSVRQSVLSAAPWRTIYLCIEQRSDLIQEFSLVWRDSGARTPPGVIRELLNRQDPSIAFSDVRSMQTVVNGTTSRSRFNLALMLSFALLALVLAAIGIYGVVSFSVQQRTREIGIRMALGARVEQVLRLILGEGIRLILLGGIIGLGAGALLMGWLSSLLYQVQAYDPAVFAGGVLVLGMVALFANYMPARRASRVDPVAALRSQ